MKINSVLKEILENVKPSEDELREIKKEAEAFVSRLRSEIRKKKVGAEVFFGGSYAKGTMIKKELYDVDIFVRFQDGRNVSEQLEKLLKFAKHEKIHGSRDYFRIKVRENLFFEVVPVKKIRKPEDAENTTDLSYFHVSYVNKKTNEKTREGIVLAKSFCNASQAYGAESYINGFSGYSLELLIIHYGSFLNFIKKTASIKNKEVIDIEKKYKNKKIALMDINESKLGSPVILVDPTYKQRNALAALSDETFRKFQAAAKNFLKKPCIEAFESKKIDLEKIEEGAKKYGSELLVLEAETKRQDGDIAGSKLFKFYKHIENELSRFFEIKNKGFNYNKRQSARYFFVLKNKEKIIFQGPKLSDKKNIAKFRERHKKIFAKQGRVYAKKIIKFGAKKFIEDWKKKNKGRFEEMSISEMNVLGKILGIN